VSAIVLGDAAPQCGRARLRRPSVSEAANTSILGVLSRFITRPHLRSVVYTGYAFAGVLLSGPPAGYSDSRGTRRPPCLGPRAGSFAFGASLALTTPHVDDDERPNSPVLQPCRKKTFKPESIFAGAINPRNRPRPGVKATCARRRREQRRGLRRKKLVHQGVGDGCKMEWLWMIISRPVS
jgi:hypothetical protein